MTVFVAGGKNPFAVMTYNWKTAVYLLYPNVFKVSALPRQEHYLYLSHKP